MSPMKFQTVKNLNKIVHFNRLKKAVVRPQTPVISENESLDSSSSDEPQYEAPLAKPKRRDPRLNSDSVPAHNTTAPTVGAEVPAQPAPVTTQPEPQRVSARSTKGVVQGRYSPLFMIICIIINILLSGVGASSVSPWGAEIVGEPISKNSILWHLLKNTVLLKNY